MSDSNASQFAAWGRDTFQFLNSLRLRYGSSRTGICLVSGYEVFASMPREQPFWARDVLDFRLVTGEELAAAGMPGHGGGYFYTSLIVDMHVYMQWLHREVYRLGGRVHIRELQSLGDVKPLFPGAQLVVNCSGLGSSILARDASMLPVAGHIVKVKLPATKHFYMDSDNPAGPSYIFPRTHDIIVGGTYHKQRADCHPNICTRMEILSRAARLLPEIEEAEIVGEYVGLRPYRDVTRVELDREGMAGQLPLIHNYGHGGSGVTLHWGCAITVCQFAEKILPKPKSPSKIQARL